MNLKDYVISENRAVVRNNNVVVALRDRTLNKSQYKLFAAQRAYVATNFIRLVGRGVELAKQLEDQELASALQSNLNDELGIDTNGKFDPELNHRNWKKNYLSALGLEADIEGFPLLNTTHAHVQAFLDLEADGTVFSISGAILSLENIIPLEYRAAVSSRDHLFPQIFCTEVEDAIDIRAQKDANRKYMDDHIIHDAKSHFPSLLQALVKYEDVPIAMSEIQSGIDIVNTYRKRFYEGLHSALQFGEPMMNFYTYGHVHHERNITQGTPVNA